jgi:hypothetical protein
MAVIIHFQSPGLWKLVFKKCGVEHKKKDEIILFCFYSDVRREWCIPRFRC